MRGAAAMLAILLATMLAHPRTAAADGREWFVSVGAGAQGGGDERLWGGCATVAALTPVRPWFLLGGEVAWYEMPAGVHTSELEIAGGDSGYERSRAVTGTITGRFQFPVRGVSPFLLAEVGIGGIAFGDEWWASSAVPPVGTIPGQSSLLRIAGVGLGLRLTAARPWPDVEASARTAAWTSTSLAFKNGASNEQLNSLRVAFTW
jgi:hypothetical protein